MVNKGNTVWGIHAGRTGDADTLFLKKNVIAVGWDKLGDPSKIKPDRDSFKAKVMEAYPNTKPAALPNSAGQVFRFVHELKIGDVIVYPSKHERQIHIGRIEGEHEYKPALSEGYPNTRPVKWLKSYPRTYFSQGALYEIGSSMSLFQIKTYSDEFLEALEGKTRLDEVKKEEDETVAYVVEDIEQTARDFIIKRLAQQLKGHPLAYFVSHLLEKMGYQTRVSPEGPDGGIDIIAHKDELGFEPPIIKVQVKSVDAGNIGDPAVSALYGKIGTGEYGLFITLGAFTKPAINFASGKSNLRLIDGEELVDLVLEHYDEFDSRYKGLLPLKRVFIPEIIEEAD